LIGPDSERCEEIVGSRGADQVILIYAIAAYTNSTN
jgi:hypothetical protein